MSLQWSTIRWVIYGGTDVARRSDFRRRYKPVTANVSSVSSLEIPTSCWSIAHHDMHHGARKTTGPSRRKRKQSRHPLHSPGRTWAQSTQPAQPPWPIIRFEKEPFEVWAGLDRRGCQVFGRSSHRGRSLVAPRSLRRGALGPKERASEMNKVGQQHPHFVSSRRARLERSVETDFGGRVSSSIAALDTDPGPPKRTSIFPDPVWPPALEPWSAHNVTRPRTPCLRFVNRNVKTTRCHPWEALAVRFRDGFGVFAPRNPRRGVETWA